MRLFYILIITALLLSYSQPTLAVSGTDGQLIKSADSTAVYIVIGSNRYVFPDLKTYQSWHGDDFSAVKTVSSDELISHTLKGNVTHKPGSLIKIQTDPKVYEVKDDQGSISTVADEATAIASFGANWATLVRDVPDAFFVNYQILILTSPTAPVETPTTTPPITPTSTIPIVFDQTPATPSLESSNLIRISNNQLADDSADIAWTDGSYGVTWIQGDNLYFNYIQSSTLGIGSPSKINGSGVKAKAAQLTWDGDYFAVVWKGEIDGQTNLYFSKLGDDGRIWVNQKKIETIDSDSTVSITDNDDNKYAVAWDKSLTNSSDQKEIFFANLDDTGVVKNSIVQITTSDSKASSQPRVLWNNTNYGIFWQDQRDGNAEIYYNQVDTTGARINSDIRITNADGVSASPSITWDGTTYGLVFADSRAGTDYYFNRVYAGGSKFMLTDKKIVGPSSTIGEGVDITYLNNYYYLAATYKTASAKPDDGAETYLIKITDSGEKWIETRLTYNPWQSSNPVIAESNDSVGIIWTDGRATCENCGLNEPKRNELYFVKIDED